MAPDEQLKIENSTTSSYHLHKQKEQGIKAEEVDLR